MVSPVGGDGARRLATPEDAKRLIDQAFTDRISWTAARVLLERVRDDPSWHRIDPELTRAVDRFLERHPDPTPEEPPSEWRSAP